MTTSLLDLRFSQPIPGPIKRKRVLLVDTSRANRELRAEIMRGVGMDVDCAADISEGRAWWRADLYNLVLISAENEHGRRDKFCEDIRGAIPAQQVEFLVGKPKYLSASPNLDEVPALSDGGVELREEVRATLAAQTAGNRPPRWGILEACQRISAVRSTADARTRAVRDRPSPPRDSETVRIKQTAESAILPESNIREEMS